VDHEGEVLESFATKQRDKAAELKFIKRTMKRHGQPRVIVTDGLRSYRATLAEVGNVDRQEIGRWANNRKRPVCAVVWASCDVRWCVDFVM